MLPHTFLTQKTLLAVDAMGQSGFARPILAVVGGGMTVAGTMGEGAVDAVKANPNLLLVAGIVASLSSAIGIVPIIIKAWRSGAPKSRRTPRRVTKTNKSPDNGASNK